MQVNFIAASWRFEYLYQCQYSRARRGRGIITFSRPQKKNHTTHSYPKYNIAIFHYLLLSILGSSRRHATHHDLPVKTMGLGDAKCVIVGMHNTDGISGKCVLRNNMLLYSYRCVARSKSVKFHFLLFLIFPSCKWTNRTININACSDWHWKYNSKPSWKRKE